MHFVLLSEKWNRFYSELREKKGSKEMRREKSSVERREKQFRPELGLGVRSRGKSPGLAPRIPSPLLGGLML